MRQSPLIRAAFPRPASISCIAALLLALLLPPAQAQEIEPRAYSNTPVGINFLLAGYVYSDGDIAFDPSSRIADAKYDLDSGFLAYAHSLDMWGSSAKFDLILPYSSFSGHGMAGGQRREREMSGPGDPRFRFSVNFHGAPALSLKEFAGYRQDLIVGASLQVTAPLGDYDNGKLINLGNNRWSFKPELGISKAWGQWTLELAPSVTIYTDNTDFNNGKRFEQAPLYALQGHLIYGLPSGVWLALDTLYFSGARTTVDGKESDNRQTNTRAGLTLALPLDRHQSLKLNASTGTSTRTGSEYDSVGIAWQYRWGGGY